MAPTIRRAEPGDDEALRALDVASWSPDASPGPMPVAGEPFFDSGRTPDNTLVVIMDGSVAGYVQLAPTTELASNRHVLRIQGLAVDPGHRRRGLGRLLMDAAIGEASARGALRLTLRVLAPNVAARATYEACGFEVEGVLRSEFLLEGRYVDDVLMAVDLADPG